jgi:hypothetical protein
MQKMIKKIEENLGEIFCVIGTKLATLEKFKHDEMHRTFWFVLQIIFLI